MGYKIINGNSINELSKLEDNSIDACITDPPYGMNMDTWDSSVPTTELWKEVLRVLKPGAFCLSFCSPELYHRMAIYMEDAGFVVKDMIQWIITTKMVKKNKLKPAHEPIAVCQKPFDTTLKANVGKWGVGEIDTLTTRIPWEKEPPKGWVANGHKRRTFSKTEQDKGGREKYGTVDANPDGRYPSNVIGHFDNKEHQKFFYAPRVTKKEKGEYNNHPTVKPIDLMRYLIRVYSPKNGTILDPFNGSGTTGIAALQENRKYIGIELSSDYCDISKKRIKEYTLLPAETLFVSS